MQIPNEIKIHPKQFPTAGEIVNEVLRQVQHGATMGAQGKVTVVEKLPESWYKSAISIATNAWRIRCKVADSDGVENSTLAKDDIKKVLRYVEGIIDSLSAIEIEIKDRTGQAFDYGLPEKIITTIAQQGISRDLIRETLRPTIYFKTQIAQQGEVVLATPGDTDAPPEGQGLDPKTISDNAPPPATPGNLPSVDVDPCSAQAKSDNQIGQQNPVRKKQTKKKI